MIGQARQQALICRPYRRLLADQLGTAALGRATWSIAGLVADHGHYAERRTTSRPKRCRRAPLTTLADARAARTSSGRERNFKCGPVHGVQRLGVRGHWRDRQPEASLADLPKLINPDIMGRSQLQGVTGLSGTLSAWTCRVLLRSWPDWSA